MSSGAFSLIDTVRFSRSPSFSRLKCCSFCGKVDTPCAAFSLTFLVRSLIPSAGDCVRGPLLWGVTNTI
eukprot:4588733-Amphidinium_carterae.1